TRRRYPGAATTAGVRPTRRRRGATGTPALLRRAIARRKGPPPAIGIDAKSCSEFRAEEVPLLIIDRPAGPPWLRRTNVWLRVTSPVWGSRLHERRVPTSKVVESFMSNLENRCANCGGEVGVVPHHHCRPPFFCKACKANFLARTARDHAWIRKWFGLVANRQRWCALAGK